MDSHQRATLDMLKASANIELRNANLHVQSALAICELVEELANGLFGDPWDCATAEMEEKMGEENAVQAL